MRVMKTDEELQDRVGMAGDYGNIDLEFEEKILPKSAIESFSKGTTNT
jgi:hypothetical protein